ncbi:uncharacterized protein RCC_01962 [Ramularia collo-cygni]|uniref:NAD(P)-binding domain-containing protein n=1 Tax=Ramularia collo-cygni TaxID=112498 RepID=A0A2D3UN64_9PEZI|nr:uncharacterized protein RCC_01962 [Ramularia collo-cygni]CZT16121.1 uncharacterized protein RCC_01962 [Ramularia collo-cygni]
MHILVLGATGPSGIAFVEEALKAGHELTIYARNPSKLPEDVQQNSHVQVIKGTFEDMDTATQALHTGATALVSFAGPGMPAKGTPVSEFYERLFSIIRNDNSTSIRRCLILATPSFAVPEDGSSWKWWFVVRLVKTFLGDAYAEVTGIGRVVSALPVDEIQWTIFRVPGLTNKGYLPVQAAMVGDGKDGMQLSRKSNAVWVLQELQEGKWIGKAPVLSNPGWM